MLNLFVLLQIFSFVRCLPLQPNSLITLRTIVPRRGPGGNTPPPLTYNPLVLEEWGSSGLLQEWMPSCTLPGLSTETWTEGRLSPRYPWGDQVWFLCRNVPVNSSLSINPAPVDSMYLTEEGSLNTCIEDFVYPNGTNLINIVPYRDQPQGLNVFYLLGGGTTTNPPIPRIRVDSGACSPADTEGSLLTFSQGITINQLRILDRTLYGTGLFVSASGGIPQPTIYQIGAEGVLPTGTRNPIATIPGFPLILSVWTDPFSPVWWRTGINRTAYLARHNNSDGSDLVYPLPPSSSTGTLGGLSWSIATARQEGQDFAVYLSNTSHIVKNTFSGLQNGVPYQTIVQAPLGWRYLSAHARNPNIPSPSATATATSTSSATATATSSGSATATATSSASATLTSSTSATATATSSTSATATATSSTSATATASSSASSNTIIPENNQINTNSLTPSDQAGIGIGSIVAVAIVAFLVFRHLPVFRNLYTRLFGMSVKSTKKGITIRNPVPDVPITISHNPTALLQYRLQHLKQITTTQDIVDSNSKQLERTKKEFTPIVT